MTFVGSLGLGIILFIVYKTAGFWPAFLEWLIATAIFVKVKIDGE